MTLYEKLTESPQMLGKFLEGLPVLDASDQFVRIGLQRGILPIGTAIKMSSKWTYQISPKMLEDYIGADISKELERIRIQRKGEVE